MKATLLTEEEIKNIISEFTSTDVGVEKLSIKYKVGKVKIRKILKDANIPKKKPGNQSTEDIGNKSKAKYLERFKDAEKNKKFIAKCKFSGRKFDDYLNASGALSEHITKHYSDVVIPNTYFKRKYYLTYNKYWHEQYFDILCVDKNS